MGGYGGILQEEPGQAIKCSNKGFSIRDHAGSDQSEVRSGKAGGQGHCAPG
jgi:hypothetical protein